MNDGLTDSSILQRNQHQLFSQVDNEIVMLNVATEEYVSLNNIGTEIWRFLENPKKYANLISYLTDIYDIKFEECKRDVNPFLIELINIGLVNIIK